MDIASILIVFGVVLASLTVHEWAHAVTADRLGDPTARLLGRVSFNPIVHIDPIGTVLLPLMAMFTTGFIFGWAKPVPVNISRFGNPKRDFMIVAAAGPASNLAIATAAALVFRSLGGLESAGEPLMRVLYFAVSINVLLAVFNMLPVPPLDGGNVLSGLLPDSFAPLINGLRQYGFIILLALIVTGVLRNVIEPISDSLERLLLL
ncbi:MAG: site-2 protease family protein [Vicinamibacterales bacterium]